MLMGAARAAGSAGLPLLSTIPVVGGLFGNQTWNLTSELVMLITHAFLKMMMKLRAAVDELRKRGN